MGPLDGIVVLDLSRVLAGPICTMLLADLGANVIKIEAYPSGDDARTNLPFVHGESSYFMSLNRGKRSIVINLKKKEGKEILLKMVPTADILVENFRPGTMEKLGLGYATLKAINEKIIYCSISGFGQTGPYKDRPAYDIVIQAMSGLMSINGQPDGPPTRVGTSISDITAGFCAAVGILSAMHKREKDGQGQQIDVSMLDCTVYSLENAIARYFATGVNPGRIGNRHSVCTPFDTFPTKDGTIAIAVQNNAIWERFCKGTGAEHLIKDPRFDTNTSRTENERELKNLLVQLLSGKTTGQWIELLIAHSVPCGPINSISDVVTDPHILEHDMIVEVGNKHAGEIKITGIPMKFSDTKCAITAGPPILGQHTEEILTDMGFTLEEINSFKSSTVVA